MSNQNLFNDNWLKLQQQYWEGLTEMGRKAVGGAVPATSPWDAAMTQWWQAVSPAASDPSKKFMDHLMEQGKTYFATVERFMRGLPSSEADAPGSGWAVLSKTFDDMQKAFTGGVSDGDESFRRMLGFWEMPLDNWQRTMSSLSPMMPGDLLRNMPHDQVKEGFDRMLSAPGLGYSREEQAQYQDLIRRSMDYQKAFQEYLGFFNQLGMKSVERMRSSVQSLSESGKPIDSARVLYDNWVMCCEAVYAEEVSTPEYARIHGQLVNTQMALKKRMSVMVDESLGAMNMPTRSELRTLQDRLQETRRENKHLRHELDIVKRQIANLPGAGALPRSATAAPVAARTSAQAPRALASSAAPATKKTIARKKTATKSAPKPASR
ncbi:MAG: class III poly(R)-hydroxyalkanoic acid synthase subunit PhaE [Thiohalocapsa sp.]